MKPSKLLIGLAALVALLAIIVTAAGLFYQSPGEPFSFTTVHGQTLQMDGSGLYRNDSQFSATIFRGTDAVMLFLFTPVFLYALLLYRRGSLRGGLLLTSMLGWYLYNAIHAAFSITYNPLFLVYLLYFSGSLFAFVYAFSLIDLQALPAHISAKLPHRRIIIFLCIAGLSVLVWLIDIIGAMGGGIPTALGPYTTLATYSLDLGVIGPTVYLAAYLLSRRAPLGYLLASVMLVGNTTIGPTVVGQTAVQLLSGVQLTPFEMTAFVAPFVLTSGFAAWMLVSLYRNISESPVERKPAGKRKALQAARA